jgi:hypothetical protein
MSKDKKKTKEDQTQQPPEGQAQPPAVGQTLPVPAELVTEPLQPDLETHLRWEAGMVQGKRQYAENLRNIVETRSYRRQGYDSLEEYMNVRWASNRNDAYKLVNWLKAVEFLEANGVTEPLQNLSKEAALVFRRWASRPEVFYLAYQQIVARQEEPTQQRLEEESKMQQEFLIEADRTPDLTQEEFQAYRKLASLSEAWQLKEKSASAADLLEACLKLKRRPSLVTLTSVARGPALLTFVEQLEPVKVLVTSIKEKKARLEQLERQKREKDRELLAPIRQLQDEIAEAEGDEDQEADEEQGAEDEEKEDGKGGLVDLVFSVRGTFRIKDADAVLRQIKKGEVEVSFAVAPKTQTQITLATKEGNLVSESADWKAEAWEEAEAEEEEDVKPVP